MAGTYEEDFVYREIYNLTGNTLKILEFGCGQNKFIDKIVNLGHDVTAIDLYQRTSESLEQRKFNFLQGDFETVKFEPNIYDCIYALSSIEHIGLEDKILEWKDVIKKTNKIIDKFRYILKKKGTLLVTLPFGNHKYWYVDNKGNSTREEIKDGLNKSLWGAREYDIDDIDKTFCNKGFELNRKEFYLHVNTRLNYFDKNSWIITKHDYCYNIKEPAGAVVCLMFIKTNL